MKIVGYVPFFNNAVTVRRAIASLLKQEPALGDIFAIDDGSTDDGAQRVESLGVRTVRMGTNLGRGAARAAAMREARGHFVISCDACAVLPADFARKARRWFEDSDAVAAVYGVMTQTAGGGPVRRWRGRHLFRTANRPVEAALVDSFSTYGAMVRREAVMDVGNFNKELRYAEDAELGRRLRAAGWQIVFDPDLEAECICENTLAQVMERYWRWHARPGVRPSVRGYVADVVYSVRAMVRADLAAGDPACAAISLLAPHYRFWVRR